MRTPVVQRRAAAAVAALLAAVLVGGCGDSGAAPPAGPPTALPADGGAQVRAGAPEAARSPAGPASDGRHVPPAPPTGTPDAPVGAPAAGRNAPGGQQVALPVRVRVPGLGIDSALEELRLGPTGELAAPRDWDTAGWYVDGVRPGARGPAVIAGHVDSRRGPAVFHGLPRLQPSDAVEVVTADGATLRFAVTRVQQVAKDAFPTADVYGPVPDAQLRLITCGGVFDRATGHYVDNVVVHATRVA